MSLAKPPTTSLQLTVNNPFAIPGGGSVLPKLDSKNAHSHARRLLAATGHDVSTEDASGFTMAFARSLEFIYPEITRAEFPEFKARKLFPVDGRVPNWVDYFTYRQMTDDAGMAALDQTFSKNAPTPKMHAKEFPQRVVSMTSAYEYNFQELRAAAAMGIALDAELGRMAKGMHERRIENLAALGTPVILQPDGTTQMYGVLNAPNVTATTQVSTLDWLAQYAADASTGKTTSIAAMVSDLSALRIGSSAHPTEGIMTKTANIYGDIGSVSLVFPSQLYNFLSSTPRSIQFDSTGQTLLDYLVKATGFKDADFWLPLNTAGASSKGRILAYVRDPEVVRLVIPQEFEQFAPQPDGFGFYIPCHSRTGAIEVKKPKAMTYMDGPSP